MPFAQAVLGEGGHTDTFLRRVSGDQQALFQAVGDGHGAAPAVDNYVEMAIVPGSNRSAAIRI
jgi:hypothetical protein